MEFLTNLAYAFAVLSGLLVVARIVGYYTYSELERMLDDLNGIKRTFPITTPGITFIVCICWIISN